MQAAERKRLKYEDIISHATTYGYTAKLITLEVGSRGIVNEGGFMQLKDELNIPRKDLTCLLVELATTAIRESYKIWCKRNSRPSSAD